MFRIHISIYKSDNWKTQRGLKPSDVLQYKVDEQRWFWDGVKLWMEFASAENHEQQLKIDKLRQENRELKIKLKRRVD